MAEEILGVWHNCLMAKTAGRQFAYLKDSLFPDEPVEVSPKKKRSRSKGKKDALPNDGLFGGLAQPGDERFFSGEYSDTGISSKQEPANVDPDTPVYHGSSRMMNTIMPSRSKFRGIPNSVWATENMDIAKFYAKAQMSADKDNPMFSPVYKVKHPEGGFMQSRQFEDGKLITRNGKPFLIGENSSYSNARHLTSEEPLEVDSVADWVWNKNVTG